MADYFLVRLARGRAWDRSVARREQAGWDEHAAFMDVLVEERVVLLGGPVGEGDGDDSLLVVTAESEAAIRERLAADPWIEDMLTIRSIEPWSIWLRADGALRQELTSAAYRCVANPGVASPLGGLPAPG